MQGLVIIGAGFSGTVMAASLIEKVNNNKLQTFLLILLSNSTNRGRAAQGSRQHAWRQYARIDLAAKLRGQKLRDFYPAQQRIRGGPCSSHVAVTGQRARPHRGEQHILEPPKYMGPYGIGLETGGKPRTGTFLREIAKWLAQKWGKRSTNGVLLCKALFVRASTPAR